MGNIFRKEQEVCIEENASECNFNYEICEVYPPGLISEYLSEQTTDTYLVPYFIRYRILEDFLNNKMCL